MGGLKRSASAAFPPEPNRKITELFGPKRPATVQGQQAPPPTVKTIAGISTPSLSSADTFTTPLPKLYLSELLFQDASEIELQSVLSFCDATASSPSTALQFLEKHDGNMEVAVQNYFDQDTGRKEAPATPMPQKAIGNELNTPLDTASVHVSQRAAGTPSEPIDLEEDVVYTKNKAVSIQNSDGQPFGTQDTFSTKGKAIANYNLPPVSGSETIVYDADIASSTDGTIHRSYVCYKDKSPTAFEDYVSQNANNQRDRAAISNNCIFDSDLHKAIKNLPTWEKLHELQPVFGPFDATLVYLHHVAGFGLKWRPSRDIPTETAYQLQQMGYDPDLLFQGTFLEDRYVELKPRLLVALDALKYTNRRLQDRTSRQYLDLRRSLSVSQDLLISATRS
jgi:hypothetical protein